MRTHRSPLYPHSRVINSPDVSLSASHPRRGLGISRGTGDPDSSRVHRGWKTTNEISFRCEILRIFSAFSVFRVSVSNDSLCTSFKLTYARVDEWKVILCFSGKVPFFFVFQTGKKIIIIIIIHLLSWRCVPFCSIHFWPFFRQNHDPVIVEIPCESLTLLLNTPLIFWRDIWNDSRV